MEQQSRVSHLPGGSRTGERSGAALAALVDEATRASVDANRTGLLLAARGYGEACAADNRSIEDAFAGLTGAQPGDVLALDAALLGAVVRGYTDYLVRLRGLVRRGGTGPLSSHVARLAALHRINQAATASLDLESMLQTVVEVVLETMAADSCSIFLYESASAMLTLRATVGLNPEAVGLVRIPLGLGITGQAAATRHLLAVPEARTHPAYYTYPLVGDDPYTSQVSVPLALRAPDSLVGVLNILTLARREFDLDELAFLETAAGEIAIAIENARLYSETDAQLRRRVMQLGTLQRMSRMVASTLDLSEVLRLLSRQTVDLAQATAAEIYRRSRDRDAQFELLARFPPDDTSALQSIASETRDLVEEVVRSGTPIWRHIQAGDTDLYVYALPMATARRAVGAICVFHAERPAEAQETEGLLHAFSDSAAIAIENAELYEDAVRGFTRASTLLQEMHHRVRNNLQTVAALLSMQARHAGNAGWTMPLQEAVSRIRSIAAIHDVLSGGNLRETTVDTIARHVVDEAIITIVPPGTHVEFRIAPSQVRVSSRQATVLALLVNEFLTNAVMHGLVSSGRAAGQIDICGWEEDGTAVVEVADDGAGLPEGFSLTESAGLGLRIARTLVEVDLRGSLEIRGRETGGSAVSIRFPLPSLTDEA